MTRERPKRIQIPVHSLFFSFIYSYIQYTKVRLKYTIYQSSFETSTKIRTRTRVNTQTKADTLSARFYFQPVKVWRLTMRKERRSTIKILHIVTKCSEMTEAFPGRKVPVVLDEKKMGKITRLNSVSVTCLRNWRVYAVIA